MLTKAERRARRKRIGQRLRDISRDVGTASARIVTDAGLDLANVATGFKFDRQLEASKAKLADAGVRSAAEVIEKNRYGFLKEMEAQAHAQAIELSELSHQAQQLDQELEARAGSLFQMLAQVKVLTQMCAQARELVGEDAAAISAWQREFADVEPLLSTIAMLQQAQSSWERVQRMVLASGIVDVASLSAGVASSHAVARATKLTQAARQASGAKAASLTRAASKAASLGKLAARASGALTVVTIGLDIGASVAALEATERDLTRELRDLSAGLTEAKQLTSEQQQALSDIDARIDELVGSVRPKQTRASWDAWVVETEQKLRLLRSRQVSEVAARARAVAAAERSRDRGYGEHRAAYVASVDPSISIELARTIIAQVDAAATNRT